MASRTIKFEGKTYQFPDDATEQEISEALAGVHDQGPPANVTNDPRMENPLSNAHISTPESGLGGFFSRKLASVKTALGGNKPERGSGSGAVDLVGGPAIGPLHVAHGVTQMPRHPVKGFNEAVGGVAQTASLPLAVAAPAAIPMSLPYVAGAKAGAWGLTEAGKEPDKAEALSNLVTMGVAGRGPLIRGTGNMLKKVGSTSDIPDLPLPTKAGVYSKAFNAIKRPIGQAGRAMSNYGVPQAPNVFEGDASGPLPGEPDLPTPVKPDGAAHHNDVTDHGELNKLLDQVSQQPEVRQGRDPVRADDIEHHNDVNPKYAAVDGTTTKLATVPKITLYHGTTAKNIPSILREGLDPSKSAYGPEDEPEGPFTFLGDNPETAEAFAPGGELNLQGVKGAILKAEVPENSVRGDLGEFFRAPNRIRPDQLSIHKYVGPDTITEIGSTNQHWDPIKGDSFETPPHELPESPLTKSFSADDVPTPNSDTLLRAIKSAPGWPENGLPNEPWDKLNGPDLDSDPYNRVDEIEASQPRRRASDRPFRRSTDTNTVGSAQGAADDTNDFQQAKNSLGPDASVSEIAMEAQRLKLKRTGGK